MEWKREEEVEIDSSAQVGLVAAELGGDVTVTDLPEVVPFMEANLAANAAPHRRIRAAAFSLGQQNWQHFANFWRARSRLYQNEILQENMRLTAFFKLYKICTLLHRCNLKFFAKKTV